RGETQAARHGHSRQADEDRGQRKDAGKLAGAGLLAEQLTDRGQSAAMAATGRSIARPALPWLEVLAGLVLLPAFWVSALFVMMALLPAAIFPRFQLLVQMTCLAPAAAMAWLSVRRAPSLLLAIPLLLVLYSIVIYFATALAGRA